MKMFMKLISSNRNSRFQKEKKKKKEMLEKVNLKNILYTKNNETSNFFKFFFKI